MSKLARKTPRAKRERSLQAKIPEAFQMIESATRRTPTASVEVPKLVLSGAWLKAVGFPIGSAAVLTTDRRGELALNRLGLGFPRRLYVTAERRKPK
jgi:hypothetical protein